MELKNIKKIITTVIDTMKEVLSLAITPATIRAVGLIALGLLFWEVVEWCDQDDTSTPPEITEVFDCNYKVPKKYKILTNGETYIVAKTNVEYHADEKSYSLKEEYTADKDVILYRGSHGLTFSGYASKKHMAICKDSCEAKLLLQEYLKQIKSPTEDYK